MLERRAVRATSLKNLLRQGAHVKLTSKVKCNGWESPQYPELKGKGMSRMKIDEVAMETFELSKFWTAYQDNLLKRMRRCF
jgi:hypothetical protein